MKKAESDVNTQQKVLDNKEKIANIIQNAKKEGKITYGELASQLEDATAEQIEEIFDKLENIGINVIKDDLEEEPDPDDLEEVVL